MYNFPRSPSHPPTRNQALTLTDVTSKDPGAYLVGCFASARVVKKFGITWRERETRQLLFIEGRGPLQDRTNANQNHSGVAILPTKLRDDVSHLLPNVTRWNSMKGSHFSVADCVQIRRLLPGTVQVARLLYQLLSPALILGDFASHRPSPCQVVSARHTS